MATSKQSIDDIVTALCLLSRSAREYIADVNTSLLPEWDWKTYTL